MGSLNEDIIKFMLTNKLNHELFLGDFALEKENIRVDEKGKLSLAPHPKSFGKKNQNPYIKADFSESQIEMITPVFDSMEKAHDFLHTLHDIVALELQNEYLWPSSNPPVLPEDENMIPIADMNDPLENKYRQELAEKYGRAKQLFSGIHFNFSFHKDFLRKWYEIAGDKRSFKDFTDALYLKIARNTLKYRWLLIYLTSASPVFHRSFLAQCDGLGEEIAPESYLIDHMASLRNSEYGYRNKYPYFVSFSSVDEYIASLKQLIARKELLSVKEYYSSVRLKPAAGMDYFAGLRENGIAYIELRLLDLNPLDPIGLSLETMYFIHLFLIYMLFIDDESYDVEEHETAFIYAEAAARSDFHGDNFDKNTVREQAIALLNDMEQLLLLLYPEGEKYRAALKRNKERIENKELLLANIIKKDIRQSSYIQFHLEKTKQYLSLSKQYGYQFKGLEDLELSTQLLLKAAIKRGIAFKLLDRDENFIVLQKGQQKEYVKQATKTSLDSYITALIMENKLVSKYVLEEQGIRVPEGRSYRSLAEILADYEYYKNKPIVIKPKSTNFGIGITIFTEPFTKEDFLQAAEMAFEHDDTVLLEEFISGKEYRFLVMGDEVVGILHRVPANVVGDGVHTIEQLVAMKNEDPLRGKGYKTPLEKIQLGEAEKLFLKNQGKSIADIPEKGEIVYLRENSNISTGGDSIDYTDDIPDSYKKIAIRAAKAAGAVFCGVDMMIENIHEEATESNYGIIEINFNPAIHIHCYPFKGKNRHADDKILDLLFKNSK